MTATPQSARPLQGGMQAASDSTLTAVFDAATPPTRAAAMARIAGIRPTDYARTRNHIDGAVTGLSPYLTHGLVTLARILPSRLVPHRGWHHAVAASGPTSR
jgi:deoxyribodipyrimidine photolyase